MNKSSPFAKTLVFTTGLLLSAGTVCAADGEKPVAQGKIKVVILIGGHGFDRAAFDKFWNGLNNLTCEVWKGNPYSIFDDVAKFSYDAIVLYNLSSGMTEGQKQNFLKLLDKGVGLVVWHHALADCEDWPEFEKIAGAKYWLKPGERNGVKVPQSGTGWGKFKMHIEDPQHPITRGVADFELNDESYNHQTFCEGIHVLITANDSKSDKAIAWTNQYGKARVFGCQSGHDAKVWTNESFRRVMSQGIEWVAGRAK